MEFINTELASARRPQPPAEKIRVREGGRDLKVRRLTMVKPLIWLPLLLSLLVSSFSSCVRASPEFFQGQSPFTHDAASFDEHSQHDLAFFHGNFPTDASASSEIQISPKTGISSETQILPEAVASSEIQISHDFIAPTEMSASVNSVITPAPLDAVADTFNKNLSDTISDPESHVPTDAVTHSENGIPSDEAVTESETRIESNDNVSEPEPQIPSHTEVQIPAEVTVSDLPSGNFLTAKYAPTEDKALFFVGQDLNTVQDFLSEVLPNPSGSTSYTSISNGPYTLGGLHAPTDYGAGTIFTPAQAALLPEAMLALGLYLKDTLQDLTSEKLDGDIHKLGEWIKSKGLPVFLRIGYEFDLPFNYYDSTLYKTVFRKIVTRLREAGVENFVSVWQSSAWPIDRDFRDWYPGGDVVDWMGTSWFRSHLDIQDNILNFSRSEKKPLIICEAAPQGFDNELGTQVDVYTNNVIQSNLSGEDIWNQWYEPFFGYIHKNRDVIRGVAYINTPWKNQKMWSDGSNGYWGDSRVQANEFIKKEFLKEIQDSSFWLLSGSSFKQDIQTS